MLCFPPVWLVCSSGIYVCCVCLVYRQQTPDSERQSRLPVWTDGSRANRSPQDALHKHTHTYQKHTHTRTTKPYNCKPSAPGAREVWKASHICRHEIYKSRDGQTRDPLKLGWCLFRPQALLLFCFFHLCRLEQDVLPLLCRCSQRVWSYWEVRNKHRNSLYT